MNLFGKFLSIVIIISGKFVGFSITHVPGHAEVYKF